MTSRYWRDFNPAAMTPAAASPAMTEIQQLLASLDAAEAIAADLRFRASMRERMRMQAIDARRRVAVLRG